jgi:hypothetical protein
MLARPPVPGVVSVFRYEDCVGNQLVALGNRVMGLVPKPTSRGIQRLHELAAAIGRCLPQGLTDEYYMLGKHYTGKKKKRYDDATLDNITNGFDIKIHSGVTLFIKDESYMIKDGTVHWKTPTTFTTTGKAFPDPRAIQFRDFKFAVEIARYLKPIEPALYELVGDETTKLPQTRLIGKGLNQYQRAMLLKEKWEAFDDPVAVCIDAKRFDQHISKQLLRVEHTVYKTANPDPWLSALCKAQEINRGKSTKGVRYVCDGGRMSGDMNTALGNCLVMTIMIGDYFDQLGKSVNRTLHYDILVDGDDAILLVERRDVPLVEDTIGEAFLEYGMELEVELTVDCLEDISWCQSKPIETSIGQWRFVRNPYKIFSTALFKPRFKDRRGAPKLLRSIGECEYALNQGIPLLQAYALALIRNSGVRRGLKSLDMSDNTFYRAKMEVGMSALKSMKYVEQYITTSARVSFAKAFGISTTDQRRCEQLLNNWKFSPTDQRQWHPAMVDDLWYDQNSTH